MAGTSVSSEFSSEFSSNWFPSYQTACSAASGLTCGCCTTNCAMRILSISKNENLLVLPAKFVAQNEKLILPTSRIGWVSLQ